MVIMNQAEGDGDGDGDGVGNGDIWPPRTACQHAYLYRTRCGFWPARPQWR